MKKRLRQACAKPKIKGMAIHRFIPKYLNLLCIREDSPVCNDLHWARRKRNYFPKARY